MDPVTLRVSEWVVLAYFTYLALVAWRSPANSALRVRVLEEALATVALALWLSRYDAGLGLILRNWLPGVYLLAMYWVPSRLVIGTHQRFQEMLVRFDRRWMSIAHRTRMPRAVLEVLEFSYLLCYPLIPVGLAILYLGSATAFVDRYWTAVLLAGALSYGFLPWLPTRPPRETFGMPAASAFGALNMRIVHRSAVGWNTFPSGHVATSFAAAFAVWSVLPEAGAVLVVIALGIAIASSVGRYHYAADIVTGVLVAIVAFGVSALSTS
jgi:membrane-associated phospholipid phosphatase